MRGTSETRSERRLRMGAMALNKHYTPQPTAVISLGVTRYTVKISAAFGIDLRVRCSHAVSVGQRVTALFGARMTEADVAIPGVVHWSEITGHEFELGIVLQEQMPEIYQVRSSECARNSMRFTSRVRGTLSWHSTAPVSAPVAVRNYSRDGLCLEMPVAPPVETEVTFRWLSAAGEHSIDGVVHWIIGEGEKFLVGCELTRESGYRISGVTLP